MKPARVLMLREAKQGAIYERRSNRKCETANLDNNNIGSEPRWDANHSPLIFSAAFLL